MTKKRERKRERKKETSLVLFGFLFNIVPPTFLKVNDPSFVRDGGVYSAHVIITKEESNISEHQNEC